MARRGDTEFAVKTEGLGKLNRDLGKIDRDLRKDSVGRLREVAKKVRGDARSLAPKGTAPKTPGVPHLAQSLRYSASNRGAAITSAAPHAPVWNYGGTIRPSGSPIEIPRTQFMGRAVAKNTRHIEDELGELVESLARRNGFR